VDWHVALLLPLFTRTHYSDPERISLCSYSL